MKPETLGGLWDRGHRTLIWSCAQCGRFDKPLHLAILIVEYGPGQPLPGLSDKMTCEKCGPKGIVETRQDWQQHYARRGH